MGRHYMSREVAVRWGLFSLLYVYTLASGRHKGEGRGGAMPPNGRAAVQAPPPPDEWLAI
ncbi:hypothetical protein E2C01_054805 [Portunus trituberculatus]|uniref:Uncharacterized protein n=1 Tax=Portunus trituberculatus TaxID=210409 RepID=A0A5B7GSX5_PORTR|nr:hypothetical protein [Portunus trituberculatus]